MSYYVDEEDDIYLADKNDRNTHAPPSSKRKSKAKKNIPDSGRVDLQSYKESYNENNMVGNHADPEDRHRDKDRKRRSSSRARRQDSKVSSRQNSIMASEASQSEHRDREYLALSSRKGDKKSKKKKKSRQEQVYDDLYGGTNYQEVDDGIVGCADDLCVNKADYADLFAADSNVGEKRNTEPIYSPNTGADNKNLAEDDEVYIVRQRYGYFSIFFGVIQIIVLGIMMWQCGIAPMNINPMFGPYPDALSEWGGKNSVLIVEDGEWWRLMTPMLLHAGVIHLFCNVAVQLELGVFFEREWGSMTWLIIYLTSTLGSSVLSVITMPDAVSVGSSGAVMGLFGGKISEVICRCCEKSDTAQDRVAHQVRKEQCIGVTCSVVVVLAFSFMPYVDWAAHLGGLLAGMFVGFMCFSIHMESFCLRLLWFLVGMALTFGFFVPCIDLMYSGEVQLNEDLRDVCGYYQQNFEDYECNCMREEYLANMNMGNLGNYFNNDDNNEGGYGGEGYEEAYNGEEYGEEYDEEEYNYDEGGERFLQQVSTLYSIFRKGYN